MLLPIFVVAGLVNLLAESMNYNIPKNRPDFDIRVRRDIPGHNDYRPKNTLLEVITGGTRPKRDGLNTYPYVYNDRLNGQTYGNNEKKSFLKTFKKIVRSLNMFGITKTSTETNYYRDYQPQNSTYYDDKGRRITENNFYSPFRSNVTNQWNNGLNITRYNGYNPAIPYNQTGLYNGYNSAVPYSELFKQPSVNNATYSSYANSNIMRINNNSNSATSLHNVNNQASPYNVNNPSTFNSYNGIPPYNANNPSQFNSNNGMPPYNVNNPPSFNSNNGIPAYNPSPFNSNNGMPPYNVNNPPSFNSNNGIPPYNANNPSQSNPNNGMPPYNVNNPSQFSNNGSPSSQNNGSPSSQNNGSPSSQNNGANLSPYNNNPLPYNGNNQPTSSNVNYNAVLPLSYSSSTTEKINIAESCILCATFNCPENQKRVGFKCVDESEYDDDY
jgi:hypothetical protein